MYKNSNPVLSNTNLLSNNNLIITGLVLIIILSTISINLYIRSNRDPNGQKLGCLDTIKNIFGFLPFIDDVTDAITDFTESAGDMISNDFKKIKSNLKSLVKKKEVFNISDNIYTYDEANIVCKAYGSKLATYDQLLLAHKKGANWCNYGWSSDQTAYFPIQIKYWNKIQDTKDKDQCGKPGINGGKFDDPNLRFGINCYGYKPQPDKNKIVYTENSVANINDDELQINKYKNLIKKGDISIRPFNQNRWSKYSFKDSKYILNPTNSTDLVLEPTVDSENDPNIIVTSELE